ncbi:receptor-type tyrosine-protein phosphatase eta-like [Dendropsophus ebraccatus]|uniref:receptor-type tyrosine-protein phosphatase eta-like n=1 Tax=Dendropsophus ebraccatus TaxID=150705 RepID=UPI0038311F1A
MNSSGTPLGTLTSNTTDITLQNLTSGTYHLISVVTVGVRGYRSSWAATSVYTKPMPIKSLNYTNVTPSSVSLTWSKPDEYQTSYSYRVQTTNPSSSSLINNTIVTSPTPPEGLIFNVIQAQNLTLSWMEPVNMTGVNKSYNINYWIFSSSYETVITKTSTTKNYITLKNLNSGTNYSISVVTVGVRGYQSSPLTTSVYTKPMSVKSLQISNVTPSSVSLMWSKPDEYQTSYSYRVQTNVSSSSSLINDTIVTDNSTTISGLPDQPNDIQPRISVSKGSVDITFSKFNSSDVPMKAYAVVITREINGDHPPWGILSKTHNDFKNRLTNTCVTYIIESSAAMRSEPASGINVHVGNGKKTHSYINGALDPEYQYRVGIAGFISIKYDTKTDTIIEEQSLVSYTSYSGPFRPVPDETLGPNIGAIVGGVIGSVFLAILIGAVFLLRRKRQKEGVLASGKYGTKVENYETFFEKLQADNSKGFKHEFDSLQSVGALESRSVALQAANAEKNRQDGTFPYDKSRVKLSTLENSSNGYINANYIPGCKSEREYIAAQHPLPGTIRDFWHMIWEERINTIVMLSHHLENYREQEEEYWPKTKAKTFGNIVALFMSEQIHNDWTIRDIMVTNVKNKESLQIRQFHFTEWHESCDMAGRVALIQFVHSVRKYRTKNSSNSPTLVHCRTGTGRTGIFIALNCLIDQLERDDKVDVYGTVHKMHLHRPLMLQTQVQYMFLHRCTLDIVKRQKRLLSSHYYQNANAEVLYEDIHATDFSISQVLEAEESYAQRISASESDDIIFI